MLLSRQVCVSSALCRKNLAAAGPEKFTLEYIQKQVEEYEIGKRHLANMMGEDSENFTQEDIDVSSLQLERIWQQLLQHHRQDALCGK